MKKTSGKKHYVFHASICDFDALLLSMILNPKTYGEVDYRLLHEGNITLWYLTSTGYAHANKIGNILLNSKLFDGVIEDSRKYNKKVSAYKMPKLSKSNIKKELDIYFDLANNFCRLYRYYELPFHHGLEEKILEKITEEKLSQIIDKPERLNKIKIDKQTKHFINNLLRLGHMKLEMHKSASDLLSKDFLSITEFISNSFKVPVDVVRYMTVDEVKKIVSGKKVNLEKIKKRLNGHVFVKKKDKWIVETGDKYLYWKRRILGKQTKEISGRVAYSGKVIGKVKKHMSWTDTTHIEKGEILVTGMTNPQMIPFIKKAAAIVTDEGGITCHAAIISREMKKPCITGTATSTQMLNDGDLVEVDAIKGVVKILEKK